MTTRARITQRHSKLTTDFGYDWACTLFGKEAIESLPRYQRGPNKGKLKGYIHWEKCETGGWDRMSGQPVRPGQIVTAWVGDNAYSPRTAALVGTWLGRQQPLRSGSGYLFEEGRKRHAEEQERLRRDHEEILKSLGEDGHPKPSM